MPGFMTWWRSSGLSERPKQKRHDRCAATILRDKRRARVAWRVSLVGRSLVYAGQKRGGGEPAPGGAFCQFDLGDKFKIASMPVAKQTIRTIFWCQLLFGAREARAANKRKAVDKVCELQRSAGFECH